MFRASRIKVNVVVGDVMDDSKYVLVVAPTLWQHFPFDACDPMILTPSNIVTHLGMANKQLLRPLDGTWSHTIRTRRASKRWKTTRSWLLLLFPLYQVPHRARGFQQEAEWFSWEGIGGSFAMSI